MQEQVVTLGERTFTFGDIVKFAETASIPFKPDTLDLVLDAIDRFLVEEALNLEASRLEDRDPEFKRILNEFENGLLLFKLMEDSVWTAAAVDTAGLKAYHAPRADSFWFSDRTRVVSLRSRSDSLLQAFVTRLDAGDAPADLIAGIADDSTASVMVDTTFLAGPNDSIFDRALNLKKGEYTSVIRNSNAFMVLINDGEAPARKKTFEEARPEVLNAYQSVVEERLLERLHDKYKAKKFKTVLRGAFAEEKMAQMTDSAADEAESATENMPDTMSGN